MAILPIRLTASQAYRVSGEQIVFEQGFDSPLDTEAWYDASSGGGTLSRSATTSTLTLAVSTANGAVARVRSHARPKAAAGRSRSVVIVGQCGNLVLNQRKRWGLFDESNGHFFEVSGETLNVVRRSSVSGSVVDAVVANAAWTVRTAQDAELTRVWEIRETWPNGDISFFIDGQLVHTISTRGSIEGPSGSKARLPVTVECENTSSALVGSFELVSATVVIEAAPVPVRAFSGSATNAAVSTSDTPLLCLRPAATFGGAANWGELLPDIATAVSDAAATFKLILGATISGGSWAAPNAASIAEVNATPTSFMGGTTPLELKADAGFSLSDVVAAVRALRLRGDGTTPDTLVIAAAAKTGTVDAQVALSWKEIR